LIKKLDILIIRSFIGPFIVTFFVALFVLVMQFFWLYMDELIGKGLNIWVIIQLLVYMSTTLVPLALPLSVLLSSIMTFGDMGESFELVAIKSSGISLLRFMRPLFIFIVLVSGLAFLFNNNVIPVANLKALSLLYDVRNAKPTLNIKPDQFNNEIKGYSIRVGSKDPDGNTIHDILIYDQTDGMATPKVIVAKKGEMVATPDKQALIFRLKDGWRYEEGYEHGMHDKDLTQTRMHFGSWDKVFDLSEFKLTRSNEDLFKNAYQMMDVKQLSESMDSMKKTRTSATVMVNAYIAPYITMYSRTRSDTLLAHAVAKKTLAALPGGYKGTFLDLVPPSRRVELTGNAGNSLRSFKSQLDNTTTLNKLQTENYLKFGIEFHRKFALSFACILLYLIGAPLGAIIRKGGLGLPLVFAVVFFITFHMLNITGEKLAKAESLPPWGGMWMSTILLMPIAIWFIAAARNDSRLFTKELYLKIWRAIKRALPQKKHQEIAG